MSVVSWHRKHRTRQKSVGKNSTHPVLSGPFFVVCIRVCVCQRSIDELSTMLNGTVLAAETAGPNLRVRDKRPSQLWAGERTSHQRRGDSTGKQLAEGAAMDERLHTRACEAAGWKSQHPSLINNKIVMFVYQPGKAPASCLKIRDTANKWTWCVFESNSWTSPSSKNQNPHTSMWARPGTPDCSTQTAMFCFRKKVHQGFKECLHATIATDIKGWRRCSRGKRQGEVQRCKIIKWEWM